MPTWSEIKLILAAAGVVLACIATGVVTHKVDSAKLLAMEGKYKDAQIASEARAKTEQAMLDKISSDADKAALVQQQALLDTANQRLAAIPKHVTRGAHNCITWGLAATIDAIALDADIESMAIPPGKTFASCANLSAEKLAETVAGNYARDERNSARLKAAQAYISSIAGVKR